MFDIVFQDSFTKFSVGCYPTIQKARLALTVKRQNAINHGYTVIKQKDGFDAYKFDEIRFSIRIKEIRLK